MQNDDNYKLMAALAIGAVGGLFLGNYICKKHDIDLSVSKHLKLLSNVAEQVEDIDTENITNVKDKIQSILNSIETTYGNTKE